jgi:23S rRNA (uridine2552-2'-O)-methyltransferase
VKTGKWRDAFTLKAQKEGFPARSVYKLQEIQNTFHILKKGGRVLDLGCAPGSWLLFSSKIVGDSGLVVGIDLTPPTIGIPPNARFFQVDVSNLDRSLDVFDRPFDVVLSDMAPSTTGNKVVDSQRSLDLCESALSLAKEVLRPGGAMVCKIFHSPDFKAFSNQVGGFFRRVEHVRPKSTRKGSKEIFVVGLGKKGKNNRET